MIGDNGLGVIPLATLTPAPLLQDTLSVGLLWEGKRKKKKRDKKEKCMIAFEWYLDACPLRLGEVSSRW